ncbi:unnamed protein product [Rotaria sordida]|uniref:Uncharacterized protein n=1 Tax=Rotaria sordida TaxID=392033 RepID=A0A815SPX7_9BILA|nr:unnamed protein product [Rotaria sordida]CAF1653545.1 unnamed protein product [Rotaria sordida]
MPNPVAPKRPYGGLYGYISPFIKAVVEDFKLTKDQLPSKNEAIVPMIVEKAALGTDQHEVFDDVAQIKQQHSNHGFFRSDPNFRANHYPVYERTFHNNPAFRLLRRDDHDTSIDTVIGAFASRLADRYDRFGRDSDWNDE